MSETFSKLEVITGVARRRRFPMDQKLAVVAETMQPGMSISYVARRHGSRQDPALRARSPNPAHPVPLVGDAVEFAHRRTLRPPMRSVPGYLCSNERRSNVIPRFTLTERSIVAPDRPRMILSIFAMSSASK